MKKFNITCRFEIEIDVKIMIVWHVLFKTKFWVGGGVGTFFLISNIKHYKLFKVKNNNIAIPFVYYFSSYFRDKDVIFSLI